MDYATRLFLLTLGQVIKRFWFIVLLPIAVMVIHGLESGSWFIFTSLALAALIATILALIAMRKVS